MDLQSLAGNVHVTGSRATLKAIEKGQAKTVFLAADAEKRITEPLRRACQGQNVPIVEISSMAALGQAANLHVPAAAAAILQ